MSVKTRGKEHLTALHTAIVTNRQPCPSLDSHPSHRPRSKSTSSPDPPLYHWPTEGKEEKKEWRAAARRHMGPLA